MTQYKDKSSRQHANINAGLLVYPVLQAADILLYKPAVVPVGEDQVQHLELTRTIARKFNARYGATFLEPKALHTPVPRLLSLTDPTRKMSKSEPGGCLFLDESPAIIEQKIKRAVTDTAPLGGGEMSAGVKNLFLLLREFSDVKTVKHFETAHADGLIRYSELKEVLAKDIIKGLASFQKKYKAFIWQPKKLMTVLKSGSKKARQVAQKTLTEAKQKIGLPT
jgi:tryptophanyl-tRNA synthetase